MIVTGGFFFERLGDIVAAPNKGADLMQKIMYVASVLLLAAISKGWVAISPAQAQQYVGLIPDAFLILVMAIILIDQTPWGKKEVAVVSADIAKVDPGFDLQAWLDANAPKDSSIQALVASVGALHAKVDAIKATPTVLVPITPEPIGGATSVLASVAAAPVVFAAKPPVAS